MKKKPTIEQMYTINEIAEKSGYSKSYIRNQFRNRPGVHCQRGPFRVSIRIPESVYLKWIAEKTVPESVELPNHSNIAKSLSEALSRRA
jgi:hypothetical protein